MEDLRKRTRGGAGRAAIWRILVIALITAVCTAAIVLAAAFGYNPAKETYSLSFHIAYPGSETMKYPDGTPFFYRDVISLASLRQARESGEWTAAVDVETLSRRGDISIAAEREELAGGTDQVLYTVTVKSSYFRSRAAATAFLQAVANVPVAAVRAMAEETDFRLGEALFEGAGFGDRIGLLAGQRENILGQYDEWIERYGGDRSVAGNTLRNLRAQAALLFDADTQSALKGELGTNGYASAASVSERIIALETEQRMNEEKIDALLGLLQRADGALTAESGSSEDTSAMLASLAVRNVEIRSELEALQADDYAAAVSRFEEKLRAEYAALDGAATTVREVASALYEQTSRVSYATAEAECAGGMDLVCVGIGGCLLSFAAACAIVCCAVFLKRRKPSPAAGHAEIPAQGEQPQPETGETEPPAAEEPAPAE